MSIWTDTLEMLTAGSSTVALLSTATSGLHRSDQLLAVSYALYHGDDHQESKTFIVSAPDDILMQSAEYHRISPEMVRTQGMPREQLKEKLEELLTPDKVVFTYNSPFQIKALTMMGEGTLEAVPCPMLDLPIWIKAAESKMHFVVDLPIDKAQVQIANRVMCPAWKKVLSYRGIDPQTPPGMLPVEYNVQCLEMLYGDLKELSPDIELAI